MITAKIAQEIVQTKKFETTLHMCHVYDPQKKRLSFFMDHNSKLTLVGTRNKLLDIPCGETVTFLSKITARSKEDYETNLKIALQNYLRSTILEIHTQFPEDSEAIKEFFYSGDCNLGYPSTSIFPEFLTNIPNFHKWLSECFPKNAFTEYTGRIHEKIMIKCALFSGNLDVVANAKTHYEEQFSEQLAGQPFELMHVFYEKNKPPESLKTLLASEWPAPKKKMAETNIRPPLREAFFEESRQVEGNVFDQVRAFNEPKIGNSFIEPDIGTLSASNEDPKTALISTPLPKKTSWKTPGFFLNSACFAITSAFSKTDSPEEEVPYQTPSCSCFSFFQPKHQRNPSNVHIEEPKGNRAKKILNR